MEKHFLCISPLFVYTKRISHLLYLMKCARVIANIFTYATELIMFAVITDMNHAENREPHKTTIVALLKKPLLITSL